MLKPFWLITVSLLVAMVNGTSVSISSPSKTGPYYRNDYVSVTCGYTALPSPATGALMLRFKQIQLACDWNSAGQKYDLQHNYTGTLSPSTQTMCSTLPSNANLSTNYNLTWNFTLADSGPYECAWTQVGPATKSGELNLSPLYDSPLNLTVTVSPSPLYAGDQTTVSCSSTGGNPAPSFTYSVGSEVIPSGTFTATRSHNGTIVSCVDITHPSYLGYRAGVTTAQTPLVVHYLEAQYDCYHPSSTSEPVTLRVISHLPQNVNLAFNWTKDGVRLAGDNATYSAHYNNQSVDVYTCTAAGYRSGPKLLTFYVVWDNSTCNTISPVTPPGSPVTTSTSADTTVGLSEAAKIIIGVGVSLGLILVIIVVVLQTLLRK